MELLAWALLLAAVACAVAAIVVLHKKQRRSEKEGAAVFALLATGVTLVIPVAAIDDRDAFAMAFIIAVAVILWVAVGVALWADSRK